MICELFFSKNVMHEPLTVVKKIFRSIYIEESCIFFRENDYTYYAIQYEWKETLKKLRS